MDGNYEINSIAFSLKAMCTSKVAHQALVASGIKSSDISAQTSIATDATKRVRQLELPVTLIKMVEVLIGPLHIELMTWYRLSPEDPIFTPQGTVDSVQSVRAVLAGENVDTVTRFALACHYCIEDVIFEMFDQLCLRKNPFSTWHIVLQESNSPFVRFWLSTIVYLYEWTMSGERLAVKAYSDGFQLALREENDIAIRHFFGKAGVVDVVDFSVDCMAGLSRLRNFTNISPSTFCLLFSKLCKSDRERDEYLYVKCLLKSLMNWPYQCFLSEHVLSFARLLEPFQVFDLIRTLIEKIQNGEWHRNYLKHMAILLEFCAKFDYDLHSAEICKMICDILMNKDEHLINIMLNKLSTEEKGKVLMDSRISMTCYTLTRGMEFRILKMFIRGCSLHRKYILREFKLNFLKVHHELIRFKSLDHIKELEVEIQKFYNIIDEIDSEKRPLDEMSQ